MKSAYSPNFKAKMPHNPQQRLLLHMTADTKEVLKRHEWLQVFDDGSLQRIKPSHDNQYIGFRRTTVPNLSIGNL